MDFTRADEIRVRDSVAMVRHGDTIGTAFFVAPGLLLTCEHVVRGATVDSLRVIWSGRELEVRDFILPTPPSDLDAALLFVDVAEHPILEIGGANAAVAAVYAYGFQFRERGYFGYPAYGTLAGAVREGEGPSGRELLHIVDATISPGLSGAPLYSLKDRRVVAIVKRDRPEGGGYAIPIEQIVEINPELLSEGAKKIARATGDRSSLGIYLRTLCAEHEYVALMDLQRSLKLDDIFVSVTLTRTGVNGLKLTLATGGRVAVTPRTGPALRMVRRDMGSPQRLVAEQAISLFELVSHAKVILIGEPGCGKTTLLRHIVRRVCKGEIVRDRVPLLIRLADLDVAVGCIEKWIRAAHLKAAERLLNSLTDGICILLLDGFDEVPRAKHAVLAREIERLAAIGNQVILSCRSVSLPRGIFGSDFRVFECIGFSGAQQSRFLRQWFSGSPDRAANLEQQISKHQGVVGFARNPLLLSLMAVVTENESDFKLPLQRTELYQKSLKTLLERRPDGARSRLSVRRKLSILRRLARINFERGQEIFSEENLLEEIEQACHGQDNIDAEQVLADLVEIDGVLALHSPSRYRFLHLTFQEFLTAQSLVQSGNPWSTLQRFVDEPRWEEVIRLTCGLLSSEEAAQLINCILSEGPPSCRIGRLLLASRACSDSPEVSYEIAFSLAESLVLAIARNERSGPMTEVEDALASLARTHQGLMERAIAPAAFQSPGQSGALLPAPPFIRLLGLTADSYSTRTLRRLWDNLASASSPIEEEGLEMQGRLLDAIGQAGVEDFAIVACEGLSVESAYLAAMHARVLIELRPISLRENLLHRVRTTSGGERLLSLAILCSFHNQEIMETLFDDVFATTDYELMRAFAYHYNRSEVELDADRVSRIWSSNADPTAITHVFSMYRCFLHPLLFARLRAAALAPETAAGMRCAAIATVLRLDAESLPELLLSAVKGLDVGYVDCFRAVVVGAPTAASDGLGRQLMIVLTEQQRRDQASVLLRFAMSNRVSSLRGWVEDLVGSDDLSQTLRWQVMLALGTMGSPFLLDRARLALTDTADATVPDRIVTYRALGLMQGKEAHDLLIERLHIEADRAVVAEIIHAVGRHLNPQSVNILLALLEASNWPQHWPPPEGPRARGDQRPSDRRRLSMVYALEQIMSPTAVPYLLALSSDEREDSQIREAAMIAARNIGFASGRPSIVPRTTEEMGID
ncbi:MAG: trypsin-like peptidase domain-containing protein [Beijerinckiaceae bacterium]|nr:trypsin-like peptidase domain-containing protein [Beijerinckiaceae bacterium]